MSSSSLSGRHVVITGGAGALGGAVVEAFLEAGATCHVPVKAAIPTGAEGGKIHYVPNVDLVDEAQVAGFYQSLPAPLWASVHLAGGFAMGCLADVSLAQLRAQFEQNVTTAFLCCREAVRRFRADAAGGAPSDVGLGRLVQVASRSGLHPQTEQIPYSLSKAALVAMTVAMADELKSERILVNAVAPGTMDTPANRKAMPSADPRTWVSPREVARAILWMASPDNLSVSGVTLPIFGAA